MNELISVVIPVYNVETYLDACVRSVMKQTYSNIEIILVDDGATDNSGEMCDFYAKEDSRVKVIHKDNGGLSDARNCGIEVTKGEFITFVDSDDIVSCKYIETLYSLIKNNNADISICNCVHCFEDTDIQFSMSTYLEVLDSDSAINNLLYQKKFLVSAWSKMYRRRFFEDVIFPVGMLYEDSAIMYKIFEKAKTIVYSNAKIYAYFHRNGSITTQKFDARNFDILIIAEEIFDHYSNNNIIVKSAMSYYVVAALRLYLNCPKQEKYNIQIKKIKKIIKKYGIIVLTDINARKKTRVGLLCYFIARPFIKKIYGRVNRWA